MSTELRINWSTFPTSKYRSFHRFSKKKLSRIDWHFLSFPSYSDQDSHTPSHITCFNGIPLQNTWMVSSQLFIDVRPLGKNGMNLSRVPIFPNLSKIWYSIYIYYILVAKRSRLRKWFIALLLQLCFAWHKWWPPHQAVATTDC